MSTCTNCDAVISPGSTTCTSCGAPQRRQVCDNCGATLKSGAKSCGQCGSKRWKGPMQKQEENESIPKRYKRPKTWRQKEEKEQEKVYTDEQKRRQSDPKVQVETREGESWEKFKERQDEVEDPTEHKTLTQQLDDMGVTGSNVPSTSKPPKAKKKKEVMYYLRCKQCHLEEFLENEADGQQYCTKCGWKKQ